jgi:molecular chaperone GrpE (heat shock protein)
MIHATSFPGYTERKPPFLEHLESLSMITFHETVDIAERLADFLKSASELDIALKDAIEDLASFLSMMEFSHEKNFRDAEEALQYIDKVLIPQLLGIRDSLEAGTEAHLKRLNTASDLAERLKVRLQMLQDGAVSDLLG